MLHSIRWVWVTGKILGELGSSLPFVLRWNWSFVNSRSSVTEVQYEYLWGIFAVFVLFLILGFVLFVFSGQTTPPPAANYSQNAKFLVCC